MGRSLIPAIPPPVSQVRLFRHNGHGRYGVCGSDRHRVTGTRTGTSDYDQYRSPRHLASGPAPSVLPQAARPPPVTAPHHSTEGK
ncbi:hypothetical protein GCM10010249_05910 [Streptomyces roseolilacinus]|uniref:Uncharacterized protein n=1 Tax=Streptomyces roseolilacinus TaxID=66904 RepID=A0A918AVX5_9ACTN|nr:hypothetical protein GCM10010249_05910 [Streptomyces roseolilacinus]